MICSQTKANARAEAARILARFTKAGAMPVETAVLQPADVLLDLYGEDIRARAYVTADALRGEQMLRPDFTVPIVRMHMQDGAIPARYCYAGEVFRKQDDLETRPSEYMQVGYELFDDTDPAAADAEVFGVIAAALDGYPVTPVMGDMGLLLAAVRGLDTTEARKSALTRHIWRPRRFRALMDRFCGKTPVPAARQKMLAQTDALEHVADVPGRRSRAEIAARIETLRADAAMPPISSVQAEIVDALMALRETAPNVVGALRDLGVDMPALTPATDRLEARMSAMDARGIDVENMRFEANFGRSSMEYYDGFVFAFTRHDRADQPVVATGGRYDALTAVLGGGRGIPAVGAMIRPENLGEM